MFSYACIYVCYMYFCIKICICISILIDATPRIHSPRCHGSRIQTWLIRRSLHVLHLSSYWSFQMVVSGQWSPATNTLLLFSSAPWAYFWNHNQDTVGRNVCFWNSGIVAAAISHGWGAPNQLTKTVSLCAGSKRKHLSSTCANSGKALDCIFNPRKNRVLLCTCWKSIICFIGTF